MELKIEVSDQNEGTASPWWLIIDPSQNMECNASSIAMEMLTGPFFSREEAELVLKQRSHHYSNRAVVWCLSGCYTYQYDKKYKKYKESETP